TLFNERDSMRPIFYHQRVEKILVDHTTLLEKEFNKEEIVDAVRGCGGDKAPGLDGCWDLKASEVTTVSFES
ncbi:hypothetical protein Tco_0384082, partial [Tanacetum coccineum]